MLTGAVDNFEYIVLGRSALARVEGPASAAPDDPSRLALLISGSGGERRINVLPESESSRDAGALVGRWRAAFAMTADALTAPGATFALDIAGVVVPLGSPVRRTLEGDAEGRGTTESRWRLGRDLPRVVDLQAHLDRVAEDLATLRSATAKQHAALRRDLARARSEAATAAAAAAARTAENRDLRSRLADVERQLESARAEASSVSDHMSGTGSHNGRHDEGHAESCLRRLVSAYQHAAEAEARLEDSRERLRTALFNADGRPDDARAVVVSEELLIDHVTEARATLQNAWEMAIEVTGSNRAETNYVEAAGG
jgi:predicted  nucleic acid-binding Zn-ribbon protein